MVDISWLKNLKDKSNLILASKPLDIINAYEYIYHSGKINFSEDTLVCIIGSGRNQQSIRELCKSLNQDYVQLPSPDLYYSILPKLLAKKLPSFLLNLMRAILYLIRIPFWFWGASRAKKLQAFELIIMDSWRDKCAIASKVNWKQLAIIDGGASTVTFNLVNNWVKSGPSHAIEKYLDYQTLSRPGRVRPSGTFSGFIAKQVSQMPQIMHKHFFNKIKHSEKDIELFTSYSESLESKNIIHNSLSYSCSILKSKSLSQNILIVGCTELDFLPLQYDVAKNLQLKNPELSLSIILHPTDLGKMEYSQNYKSSILEKVQSYNLNIIEIKSSLEVDMLFYEFNPPRHLVTYNSSFISWIQRIAPLVQVHVIDEIN